jgi:hypothetical protein
MLADKKNFGIRGEDLLGVLQAMLVFVRESVVYWYSIQ